ncbi:MAG: hypothetical protein H6550_07335 [Chitinophagales bacterium]|nr:hypothetical protein [Chitinophagales bacterium]
MSRTVSFILLFIGFSLLGNKAIAQPPVLPDIIAASDKGVNVISWTCQYDGIKSIAVQRSSDSVFNYITIGYVKDLKKGQQAFIDGHPQAGDNWYRLYIGFSSDLTWYSNNIKVFIDSATLLNKSVIPPNDSLQKYAANVQIAPQDVIASSLEPMAPPTPVTNNTNNNTANNNGYNNTRPMTARSNNYSNNTNTAPAPKPTPKLNLNIPSNDDVGQYTYIKSRHVFTNPFTGHVTLELPEDDRKIYAIQFFKQGDESNPVLDIPRLRKTKVIIDKRNFQSKGVYKFILKEGSDKLEEGYISIF